MVGEGGVTRLRLAIFQADHLGAAGPRSRRME